MTAVDFIEHQKLERRVKIIEKRQNLLRDAIRRALPHMSHEELLTEEWDHVGKVT